MSLRKALKAKRKKKMETSSWPTVSYFLSIIKTKGGNLSYFIENVSSVALGHTTVSAIEVHYKPPV